jgi:hypothetical protein
VLDGVDIKCGEEGKKGKFNSVCTRGRKERGSK